MFHGTRQSTHYDWSGPARSSGLLNLLLAILLLACQGCASSKYLSVRRVPQNPLTASLKLLSLTGPKPTSRTQLVLRKYDLVEQQKDDPAQVLRELQQEIATEPDMEKMHAFGELAYIQGKKADAHGNEAVALNMYSAAVAHAYLYLFAPQFERVRNPYDPQFRQVCDLYNASLEDLLRIINKQERLRPGETYSIEAGGQRMDLHIVLRGPWNEDAFDRFEFVSDYEVKGLINRHVTHGLGVPLIAVYDREQQHQDAAAEFYPSGMSFPVTAIVRAAERPCTHPHQTRFVFCSLELHDPLTSIHARIENRAVPLETDLTTPLGFFLDHRQFRGSQVAIWGLRNPDQAAELQGLYMLEAYDPNKIPVLMVHGLWSSPETWTEMINELRASPEIRDRYQFWTYLYPTGQPFWISATRMREDLEMVRRSIDPQRRSSSLDQMVLVGHSMGGLVSRLQTLESGDDYWHLLSERSFDELQADPETRERLVRTLFFQPNSSIRRAITIATPHRGSTFSNDYTRWLGRKLITLPAMLVQTKQRIIQENPDFFHNTQVLTINTSIDSLSPDSPILPVMLRSQKASWTRYHNVVGVVSKKDLLGRISENGDGVVSFESAHLDDVDSEIVVEADHVNVHQHPRTILEIRRILLEHSAEMYAEMQRGPTAIPAGYRGPSIRLPAPPAQQLCPPLPLQPQLNQPAPNPATNQPAAPVRSAPIELPQSDLYPPLPLPTSLVPQHRISG